MTELNDINIMAYANKSPLLLINSAKNDSVESLKYLIKEGYDLTFVDIDSNTILHHILRMNVSEEKIIELIDCVLEKTGDSLLNIKNNKNLSVLESATELEYKKVSKHLLLQDSNLHKAVEKGDIIRVKLLLENGANVDEKNKDGDTPLQSVIKRDIGEEDEDGYTLLNESVNKESIEIVKLLVENKANLDKKDEDGNTPLHLALYKGKVEIVKLLIKNKADVNIKNEFGNTPLYLVIKEGKVEIVKLLVENGANVNHENKYGDTPLIWGIYNKCGGELVKFLLENKADVNHKNKEGETALFWACKNKNLEAMKLLLENGADINAKNKKGETPLHWAVKNNSIKVVRLLLENKAEVNHKNKEDETPLFWACKNKNLEAMKLLLENGATF